MNRTLQLFSAFAISLTSFCVSNVTGQQSETRLTEPSQLAGNVASTLRAFDQAVLLQSHRSDHQVRFLSFDAVDDEKRKSINEDTAIFRHLINKGLPATQNRLAMGVSVARHSNKIESIYVDGKGLILIQHVAQPVAPLDSSEAQSEPAKKEVLTDWDKAKQELQEAQSLVGLTAVASGFSVATRAVPTYDQEYATKLHEAVSRALRHSANFRDLDSDESITVIFYGPGADADERTVFSWRVNLDDVKEGRNSDIATNQYREKK